MGFGDPRMDAALDRWLTTEPEYYFLDDEWCGCPELECSFEGTEAEMTAHVAEGDHNHDYAEEA